MIRYARPGEHPVLTEISFKSKNHWNYPQAYFTIWEKELTITPEYIAENKVFVCEQNRCVSGYYSVVRLDNPVTVSDIRIEAGTWLEHMFVLPEYIGKGIGLAMFAHCVETCRERHTGIIRILADPHARGFYEKMGCRFVRDYPSTIKGRTTPYLEYLIDPAAGSEAGAPA